jgi:hypothetical protein
MIAIGFAQKSRVCTLLFASGKEVVVGGSVLCARHGVPIGVLAWADAGGVPLCAWEDDEDASYNPEELYNDSYGSLDDEEDYGPCDEYDECEDDDYEEEEEEEEEEDDFMDENEDLEELDEDVEEDYDEDEEDDEEDYEEEEEEDEEEY